MKKENKMLQDHPKQTSKFYQIAVEMYIDIHLRMGISVHKKFTPECCLTDAVKQ